MSKKLKYIVLFFIFSFGFYSNVNAAITETQGLDVAEFARNFIEQGNARRDDRGYPLLTYALSGNWNTCVEIRNSGYNEKLYYIKRNGYHINKGKYVELGNKWCMDCGTYVSYMLKKTLGLELYNEKEPWHVQDMYNDALKGEKSKYLEFVYKSVAVKRIDYSKLQPGDIIARITPNGNHGMLYVGNGEIAHANRDMITYKAPAVFGFKVSKLNQYYMPGTVLRIMRIKDGIVPEDLVVNAELTWPDNGEKVKLIVREIDESSLTEELQIPVIDKEEVVNIEEQDVQKIILSGEQFFEESMKLQEKRIETIRIKPLMVHIYRKNQNLYNWIK